MIANYDFIETPYEDSHMKYNIDFSRYILDIDHSKYALGSDEWVSKIGGIDNAKWTLDHMSKAIYEAFLFYKDSKYYDKTLYYLAHSKRMREVVYKALVDILIYADQDGGLYTAYSTGLNFNEMAKFDMTLINYIGQMANVIIVNGGIAERLPKFDLDRLTTEYETREELIAYMEKQGYLTASEYEDETTLIPNSPLYHITSDCYGKYIFYEFYQFDISKKGVEW
jgi:hypothetical protein